MMPSPTDRIKDLAAAAQQDSCSPDQLVVLRIDVAIGKPLLLIDPSASAWWIVHPKAAIPLSAQLLPFYLTSDA
jgi:hypothetical protein